MQTARRRYSAPDPGAGLTPVGGGRAVAKLISFVLNLARLMPVGGKTIHWLANGLFTWIVLMPIVDRKNIAGKQSG